MARPRKPARPTAAPPPRSATAPPSAGPAVADSAPEAPLSARTRRLFWVATLPGHVNINSLEIMPVSQSFAGFQIHRNT